MHKIVFILWIIFMGSACSVSRVNETRYSAADEYIKNQRGLEDIKKQNLTANNFFIQKADFKIVINDESRNGFGSIKFERPDKYLISIKSKGGIEIARIFISNDTILINDRVKRIFYYGSPAYFKAKYGITVSVLPLLLGDYINEEVICNSKIACKEGKFNIIGVSNCMIVKYVIDCKEGKTILALPEQNVNEGKLQIKYSNFLRAGDVLTPGKIEISEIQNKTKMEIRIDKIESPWGGTIQFIPGNNYEKFHLQ